MSAGNGTANSPLTMSFHAKPLLWQTICLFIQIFLNCQPRSIEIGILEYLLSKRALQCCVRDVTRAKEVIARAK